MIHNTRTYNGGQDDEERRNNPPQYNLCPLRLQMKEREGYELLPLAERRAAGCQPHREMRTEHLKHRLDTLTELVNTLVTALGQNIVNVAPAIPPRISLDNAKGEDAQPPQEGRDTIASEAHTETSQRQRRARHRHRNIAQPAQEDRELTPESRQTECTWDSVFNRIELPAIDPNMDDDYDSEFDHSASSRGSADLRALLDGRRAEREQ